MPRQGRDNLFQWDVGISVRFFTENTGSLRNTETRRNPSYTENAYRRYTKYIPNYYPICYHGPVKNALQGYTANIFTIWFRGTSRVCQTKFWVKFNFLSLSFPIFHVFFAKFLEHFPGFFSTDVLPIYYSKNSVSIVNSGLYILRFFSVYSAPNKGETILIFCKEVHSLKCSIRLRNKNPKIFCKKFIDHLSTFKIP